jgi:hypothetical protein
MRYPRRVRARFDIDLVVHWEPIADGFDCVHEIVPLLRQSIAEGGRRRTPRTMQYGVHER